MQVTVIEDIELPAGVAGLTDGQTIWLSPRLTTLGRRCTLAHELTHVERGIPPAGLAAKEEVKVDRLTARKLTPLQKLKDALLWTQGGHCRMALAEELDLDVDTLSVTLCSVSPAEKAVLDQALDDLGQVA